MSPGADLLFRSAMSPDRLEVAAQRVYETLARKGWGPRPWVQHGALTPPWEQAPADVREDCREAARAAVEAGGQEVMAL